MSNVLFNSLISMETSGMVKKRKAQKSFEELGV